MSSLFKRRRVPEWAEVVSQILDVYDLNVPDRRFGVGSDAPQVVDRLMDRNPGTDYDKSQPGRPFLIVNSARVRPRHEQLLYPVEFTPLYTGMMSVIPFTTDALENGPEPIGLAEPLALNTLLNPTSLPDGLDGEVMVNLRVYSEAYNCKPPPRSKPVASWLCKVMAAATAGPADYLAPMWAAWSVHARVQESNDKHRDKDMTFVDSSTIDMH
eukprot:gene18337-21870_t